MKSPVILRGCVLVAASALLLACGGAAPPPSDASDPPPLDGDSGEDAAMPASSSGVQEGIDAISAGDFEKAKEVLSKAHADNPEDQQAAYYLGVALEGSGDPDGAAEKYKLALELDPALAEAAVNLSALLLDKEDGAGALEVADAALAKTPNHAGLLTNRGMALILQGDMAGAAGALGKAVQLSSGDEALRYSYAEALAASGQKDEAAAELKKLVTASDLEVLASTARLLGRLGDNASCVEASTAAIAKKKAPELYVQRGICHHGLQDEAKAKADYEAAIGIDDKFAAAHYYLGRHYMSVGDKKKAKASLQRVVELEGDTGAGKAAAKALKSL